MTDTRSRKGLKRHDSIYVEVTSAPSSPSKTSNKGNLIHVAEIHDSKSKLLGSSGDENWAEQRTISDKAYRKQPLQLRKRHRQPRKGSETDTLSEVESDGGMDRKTKPLRQDTEDTSDKSSLSKTLAVPTAYARTIPQIDISTSSIDTSSTKDSQDYASIRLRKTRHREPRRGSLTDTLSEATDSESTIARRPVPPPRPSLDTTGDSQELVSQESVDQLSIDVPQPPTRLKKLKKKRKGGEEGRDVDDGSETRGDESKSQPKPTSDEMIVVHVEGCESLRFLDFCRCPAIRLHIVDPLTGDYKQSASNPDTTILPLETQPFNMKIHRSVRPTWDEDLIIREPSSLVASKHTLLLFELFDYLKQHIVAWAFLKLVAANGATNLGRPLRLQMFKPARNGKQPTNGPKCYGWWAKGKFSQYKSTLFISVNCISSKVPQKSVASPAVEQKQLDEKQSLDKQDEEAELDGEIVWNRYPGQSCKLPNSLLAEKECGKDGALCLSFSHNGKLLALPSSVGILLFAIPSAKLYLSLDKQQGLVYDINWSQDDEYLLSVSADSTACIWNIKRKITRAIKVLAHPSYVYCCSWISADLFATGCNDGVIRIWSVTSNGSSSNHQTHSNKKGLKNARSDSIPTEYLVKHSIRVNSLASAERIIASQRSESTDFDERDITSYILVSADSGGIIVVWGYDNVSRKFEVEKEIKLKELRGQPINKVILVTKKNEVSRLLVQTRDSLIRLLDLNNNGATLQVYEGGYIVKSKTGYCSLCGCCRRVWSPSEDSSLIAWDYATGERVASYTIPRVSQHATLTLALHPLDHIIAYTSYSPSDYPTLRILCFDRDGDGSNVGLVITEQGRRSTTNKWSSLDTPLYEVPPVRVQPPPGLRRPPSPATPSSKLSPVPTPVPRTTRRFSGEGPKTALDSVATALTNLPKAPEKGEVKSDDTRSIASSSRIPILTMKNRLNRTAELTKQKSTTQSPLSRDSRLSDIIGKMDLILVQANPKQLTSVK